MRHVPRGVRHWGIKGRSLPEPFLLQADASCRLEEEGLGMEVRRLSNRPFIQTEAFATGDTSRKPLPFAPPHRNTVNPVPTLENPASLMP